MRKKIRENAAKATESLDVVSNAKRAERRTQPSLRSELSAPKFLRQSHLSVVDDKQKGVGALYVVGATTINLFIDKLLNKFST